MRTTRWFWGTLSFWCLLASVGLSHALLWGPPELSRRNRGTFQARFEGGPVQGEAWTASGGLDEVQRTLDAHWTAQGWKGVDDGEDLVPLLLGTVLQDDEAAALLQTCVRAALYRRAGTQRVLALLRTGETQVEGWVVDLPPNPGTTPPHPGASPFKAPPGAEVTALGAGNLRLCLWTFSVPRSRSGPGEIAQRHGMSLRPWSDDPARPCFVAAQGRKRWLLTVQKGPQQETWVWLVLPDDPT